VSNLRDELQERHACQQTCTFALWCPRSDICTLSDLTQRNRRGEFHLCSFIDAPKPRTHTWVPITKTRTQKLAGSLLQCCAQHPHMGLPCRQAHCFSWRHSWLCWRQHPVEWWHALPSSACFLTCSMRTWTHTERIAWRCECFLGCLSSMPMLAGHIPLAGLRFSPVSWSAHLLRHQKPRSLPPHAALQVAEGPWYLIFYCLCSLSWACWLACTAFNTAPLPWYIWTQDSEGNYERLVEVLDVDDGAGWGFLSMLLRGEASALQLSQHRFLSPFNQ